MQSACAIPTPLKVTVVVQHSCKVQVPVLEPIQPICPVGYSEKHMELVCIKNQIKLKKEEQQIDSFRNKSLFSSVFQEQLVVNGNCPLFRSNKLKQSEIKGVIFPKTF